MEFNNPCSRSIGNDVLFERRGRIPAVRQPGYYNRSCPRGTMTKIYELGADAQQGYSIQVDSR